ncbi:MAG: hypothetical protein LBJ08_07810 [Bifidobacteriaceae bacterium]|jgi:uncharacterized protein YukE|nr:hypothetical protein [Bifidobacteriaceae bacterium]
MAGTQGGKGNFIGLNYQEVMNLSKRFTQAATQLQTLMHDIDQLWQNTTWQGQDARNFENSWNSHKKVLTTIMNNLTTASKQASTDATQQSQTSLGQN